MKTTLFKMLMALGLAMLIVGCGGNGGSSEETQVTQPETSTTETVATNGTATVGLSIIDTGIDYIKVHICTEDVDGLKRFDLYRIRSANHNDVDQNTWNLEGETKWCENQTFYGLYPDRSYIIKGVLTSYNGATLEFEQTAQTISDKTDVEPTPDPTPNTPPIANNLTVDAKGEGTVSGTIVISDEEDKTSDLKVVVKDAPTHGTIVWNSKTKFTYTVTAASGYNGDDSFTYYVKDLEGLKSTTKTVTIKFVVDS